MFYYASGVKFSLEQETNAHKGGKSIDLLFL
jgi:hypothetical protein